MFRECDSAVSTLTFKSDHPQYLCIGSVSNYDHKFLLDNMVMFKRLSLTYHNSTIATPIQIRYQSMQGF